MFVLLQRVLPKHLLSRLVGWIAASELTVVAQPFIRIFCSLYKIDLSEAEREAASEYLSFNDFFTRSLKSGVRPISGKLSSPADGTAAAMGSVKDNKLLQAKGRDYSLSTLIADSDTSIYSHGSFLTVYLAPHNYHRVHIPLDATLRRTTYVPGELFSVNQTTARDLEGLFANNERLVCHFDSNEGPFAMVLVGALLVAGIKTVWNDHPYQPKLHREENLEIRFFQGDEIGQFQMGSTAILVFSKDHQFCVNEGAEVRVGERLI